MSDSIIPEERLPAFQRWQLASFDRDVPRKVDAASSEQETLRLQEESRNLGYAAGYEEGRKRGEREAQQLHALVQNLQHALAGLDQAVADQLLSLALDIARQMLGQALVVRPALVLPVVEEAVRCVSHSEIGIRVRVHPEDAALLRAHLDTGAGREWTIVEDRSLERGGCRVDTRNAEVDATLAGRWRRVLAALGSTDEWLAS